MSIISGLLGHASQTSNDEANALLAHVLIEGEQSVIAFKLVRDQIILTNCRIIWIDKQGLTGKKQEVVSIPYKSVDRFSMENAGFLDMDAELTVWIKGQVHPIKWQFKKGESIADAHRVLSSYVLMG